MTGALFIQLLTNVTDFTELWPEARSVIVMAIFSCIVLFLYSYVNYFVALSLFYLDFKKCSVTFNVQSKLD